MLLKKEKDNFSVMELKCSTDIFKRIKNKFLNRCDFRCDMTHLNYSLEKLGKTFKLQKKIIKNRNEK